MAKRKPKSIECLTYEDDFFGLTGFPAMNCNKPPVDFDGFFFFLST